MQAANTADLPLTQRLVYTLIACMTGFFSPALAQYFNLKHYNTKDGLSNSIIYSVTQDSKGYLWIATEMGLNKFDGTLFEKYQIGSGLRENVVLYCTEDSHHTMWVSNLTRGFYPLGNMEQAQASSQDGLNKLPFHTVYFSGRYTYILSAFASLFVYDNHTKRIAYRERAFLSNRRYINKLFKDRRDNVFMLKPSGLFVFHNNIPVRYTLDNRASFACNSMTEHAPGDYWVSSTTCIYRFRQHHLVDSVALPTVLHNYPERERESFLIDDHENIWIAENLPNMLYYGAKGADGKYHFREVSEELGVKNSKTTGLFLDNQKNVWIYTYGKGLLCVKNSFVNNAPGTEGFGITSIYSPNEASYFYGTFNGILWSNGGMDSVLHQLNDPPGLKYIYGISGRAHTIYVTGIGIDSVSRNKQHGFSFYFLRNRRLFMCSPNCLVGGGWDNAIFLYDSCLHTQKTLMLNGKFVNNRINAFTCDNHKTLYVGTDNGLFAVDMNTFEQKQLPVKSPYRKIQALLFDSQKRLWVGSEEGLTCYHLNPADRSGHTFPQPPTAVTSIIEDSLHNICIGTLKGLYILRKNNTVFFIDDKMGLVSKEIQALRYIPHRHSLMAGTNEGTSELALDAFYNALEHPPVPYINSVFINNNPVEEVKQVELPDEDTPLKIICSAVEYATPKALKLQYALDERGWEILNNNMLSLATLPHGEHSIAFRASLDGLHWGESIRVFVSVVTPFYMTWWFKLFLALFGVTLLAWIVFLRLQQVELRAMEKISLQKELEDLRGRSFNATINPHFIYNAMNAVQNYINNNNKRMASDYLAKFARLIRNILEHSNKMTISVQKEKERLSYYLELEKNRFGNVFDYELTCAPDVDHLLQIPNMIIQPFIENAIIHGFRDMKEKGLIRIHFQHYTKAKKTLLMVIIEDNGVGINASKLKHKKPQHQSMGIDTIRQRLDHIPGAVLYIEDLGDLDPASHGTRITFLLPIL